MIQSFFTIFLFLGWNIGTCTNLTFLLIVIVILILIVIVLLYCRGGGLVDDGGLGCMSMNSFRRVMVVIPTRPCRSMLCYFFMLCGY